MPEAKIINRQWKMVKIFKLQIHVPLIHKKQPSNANLTMQERWTILTRSDCISNVLHIQQKKQP